jgi:hypothetical protein
MLPFCRVRFSGSRRASEVTEMLARLPGARAAPLAVSSADAALAMAFSFGIEHRFEFISECRP